MRVKSPSAPGDPEVLRNRPLHWFNWLAAIGFAVVFAQQIVSGPGPNPQPEDYVVAGGYGLVTVLGFHRATRMRVEMTSSGVTVYKLFATERVAWRDVDDVTSDFGGLHIRRTSGDVVSASSMGVSPWALWFNTDGAGRWVERIRVRAEVERRPV